LRRLFISHPSSGFTTAFPKLLLARIHLRSKECQTAFSTISLHLEVYSGVLVLKRVVVRLNHGATIVPESLATEVSHALLIQRVFSMAQKDIEGSVP
jgi:hypothetical protein